MFTRAHLANVLMRLVLLGLLAALLRPMVVASAAVPVPSDDPRKRGPMSEANSDPIAFEEWIAKTCSDPEAAKREPKAITDAIVSRLERGGYVTDRSITSLIGAWRAYDYALYDRLSPAEKERSAKNRYARTIAKIDTISRLLYARPWLRSQLATNRADLYQLQGNVDEAIATRQAAMKALEPVFDKLSVERVENMTRLGCLLLSRGKKKEAEKAFIDVLSVGWWHFSGEVSNTLFTRYVEAGSGLIQCRQGDLRALQNTFFAEGAMEQLGPALDNAIKEAGGKPRTPGSKERK